MTRIASVVLLLSASLCAADELRDPTRPATLGPGHVMSSGGTDLFRLEAVFGSGDARRAIVNGKIVREGDRVAGVLVTSITADSITYVRSGREHVAKLPNGKIAVRGPSALHAGEP